MRTAAVAASLVLCACGHGPGPRHIAALPRIGAEAAAHAEPVSRPAPRTSAEEAAAVLAAYQHARDVDATAFRTLDASALATVYARDALALREDEIATRRRNGWPMAMRMELHPHVTMLSEAMAVVDDDVRNHSVRLDPTTGLAVESDPDEVLQDTFTLARIDGTWKVVLTARVAP